MHSRELAICTRAAAHMMVPLGSVWILEDAKDTHPERTAVVL